MACALIVPSGPSRTRRCSSACLTWKSPAAGAVRLHISTPTMLMWRVGGRRRGAFHVLPARPPERSSGRPAQAASCRHGLAGGPARREPLGSGCSYARHGSPSGPWAPAVRDGPEAMMDRQPPRPYLPSPKRPAPRSHRAAAGRPGVRSRGSGKLEVVSESGRHRVVVVGGGFGGIQAVKKLTRADVDVTLVDRNNYHLFQPLNYQVATGSLSSSEIAVPLRSIFRHARNVRVVLGSVSGFDLEGREVAIESVVPGAHAVHAALRHVARLGRLELQLLRPRGLAVAGARGQVARQCAPGPRADLPGVRGRRARDRSEGCRRSG